MDEDKLRLIKELCARAGMVLEDATTTALLIGEVPENGMTVTLAGLRTMSERAVSLFKAAQAIAE